MERLGTRAREIDWVGSYRGQPGHISIENHLTQTSWSVMRHSRTGRILGLLAGACLLLALGCGMLGLAVQQRVITPKDVNVQLRSEEHTSELQSRRDLVCRLLLEKKKKTKSDT